MSLHLASPENLWSWRLLRRRGLSYAKIGALYDIRRDLVYYWLYQRELPAHQRPRRKYYVLHRARVRAAQHKYYHRRREERRICALRAT